MTSFIAFVCSFGALLALMALIAAWLFRSAGAPLWQKLAVPSLIVALACAAPFAVSRMMGFPVDVAFRDLPDRAELVAFVPRDGDKRVDLWLKVNDAPRAFETVLDARLKKTLREAQQAMGRGAKALLKKEGAKDGGESAGDRLGVGEDQTALYVLDPSALSALPPKE